MLELAQIRGYTDTPRLHTYMLHICTTHSQTEVTATSIVSLQNGENWSWDGQTKCRSVNSTNGLFEIISPTDEMNLELIARCSGRFISVRCPRPCSSAPL